MAGAAALLIGGALLGTSIAASAAGPKLSVSPDTVTNTTAIGIVPTGSGYHGETKGAGLICPIVAGEPTVVLGSLGSWPVGCETYNLARKPDGDLKSAVFTLAAGRVIADWGSSTTDSAGRNANTDAQNYPVPPYLDEHGTVEVYATFGDSASDQGSTPLNFTFNTPGATTTTTSSTTTTTQPCKAVSHSASATSGKGTVTVDPATCLVNGTMVSVKATGLTASDTGSVLECNSDKSQPTVTFIGTAIPVSCTSASAKIFDTGSGNYTTTFTVVEGVTGPPATGTDSAGNPGSTDAAKYPCPPTAAQISAGVTCVIAVGDVELSKGPPVVGGDEVPVPIAFNTAKGAKSPPTTATTASSVTSGVTTATTSSSTSTSSSSLAFTGAGPGVWWLGLIGVLMMLLGALLLLLAGPRVVFARAVHTSSRVLRRRT